MTRVARVVAFVATVAGLSACTNPLAPSAKCTALKGSACTTTNWVNPNINWVNPNINWVNPNINLVLNWVNPNI